jgi:hypothetical protein
VLKLVCARNGALQLEMARVGMYSLLRVIFCEAAPAAHRHLAGQALTNLKTHKLVRCPDDATTAQSTDAPL